MINLLPPELKDAYRYAHRNVQLVHWVVAGVISLVILAAMSTVGLIYVKQAADSYASEITTRQASLKQQNLSAVQRQVKDISGSLKLAVQVLSQEVLFSKLLTQLATITPSNAVLTDLNISQDQSTVTVSAMTADYNAATQLQVNLADPANKLFQKADIVTITCTGQGNSPRYPCSVTLSALFAKNNPYLFINNGAKQ